MDGYVKELVEFTLVTLTNVGLIMAKMAFLPCMIDTGDTAWMLTATSLVLFMSPGVILLWRSSQIKEHRQRSWYDFIVMDSCQYNGFYGDTH